MTDVGVGLYRRKSQLRHKKLEAKLLRKSRGETETQRQSLYNARKVEAEVVENGDASTFSSTPGRAVVATTETRRVVLSPRALVVKPLGIFSPRGVVPGIDAAAVKAAKQLQAQQDTLQLPPTGEGTTAKTTSTSAKQTSSSVPPLFSMRKPHLDCIDGCRFLLVFPIIVGHFVSFAGVRSEKWLQLLTQENVLVGGFFVISGYVSGYTGTKLGERLHEVSRLAFAEKYFWQRVMTYYPLHVLVSTVFAPVFVFLDRYVYKKTLPHTLFQMGLNYTLLQSWFPSAAEIWNPPTWFLSALTFASGTLPTVVLPLVSRLSKDGLLKLTRFLTSVNILQKFSYAYATNRIFLPAGTTSGGKETQPFLWNMTRFHPVWALVEIMLGITAVREVMLDNLYKGAEGSRSAAGAGGGKKTIGTGAAGGGGASTTSGQSDDHRQLCPIINHDNTCAASDTGGNGTTPRRGNNTSSSSLLKTPADDDDNFDYTSDDADHRASFYASPFGKMKQVTRRIARNMKAGGRNVLAITQKEWRDNPLYSFLLAYASLGLRASGNFPLNGTLVRSMLFIPLYSRFLQQVHRDTVKNQSLASTRTSRPEAINSNTRYRLTRLLGSAPMKKLGALSFPMFIVHGPIGQLFYKKAMAERLWGRVLRGKVVFARYLLVVTLVAHLLDRYFLKSVRVQSLAAAAAAKLSAMTKGALCDLGKEERPESSRE